MPPKAFENFLPRMKKFLLVPNDTKILNGFKDIKWFQRYYLVSKILFGFKDIIWFQRY